MEHHISLSNLAAAGATALMLTTAMPAAANVAIAKYGADHMHQTSTQQEMPGDKVGASTPDSGNGHGLEAALALIFGGGVVAGFAAANMVPGPKNDSKEG